MHIHMNIFVVVFYPHWGTNTTLVSLSIVNAPIESQILKETWLLFTFTSTSYCILCAEWKMAIDEISFWTSREMHFVTQHRRNKLNSRRYLFQSSGTLNLSLISFTLFLSSNWFYTSAFSQIDDRFRGERNQSCK